MGSSQKLKFHKFILIMANFSQHFLCPLAVCAKCNLTFGKQLECVKYSMSRHNKQARSTHTDTHMPHKGINCIGKYQRRQRFAFEME